MDNEREKLLTAALSHVSFEGMNDRALLAGAADIGMSESLVRVHFPHGGADLAAACHRRADTQLREWLATTPPDGRFRDRIKSAIWHRLSLVDPELVRAASAVFALPHNSALGAKLVWETADVIWAGLGDTSQDSNWYTKRASLSAVIASTVLFWLGDASQDCTDSQDFLDRRIEGVMQFEKLKATFRKFPGAEPLTNLAFGWIKAPHARNLPGSSR